MIASMLLGNVKYQDPTEVLEAVVDDFGNKISIYEQQDIGEFFLNFLDRLQDGLCENKSAVRKILGNDLADNMRKMSQDNNNYDNKSDGKKENFDDLNVDDDDSKPQISNQTIETKVKSSIDQ